MKRAALIAAALVSAAVSAEGKAGIPQRANAYKRDLVRVAHTHWGLNAPVSLFAGQIHQESAWRTNAQSRYADGLAQFTPKTAEWITSIYPKALGDNAAPFSPHWALTAMVLYDRRLYGAVDAATACDRWAFALSAYNGGLGWVYRDKRLCDDAEGCDGNRWWDNVEHHTNRADWAQHENRDYPRRILYRHEPMYRRAGWPGAPVCPSK